MLLRGTAAMRVQGQTLFLARSFGTDRLMAMQSLIFQLTDGARCMLAWLLALDFGGSRRLASRI